jgi:outer membrane protein assembly factor BamD (BamD/ComL family)
MNTIEGYEDFIATYPENIYVEESSYLIEDIEYGPFEKDGSVEALEEFIENYPTNRHVQDARKALEGMKEKAEADAVEQGEQAEPGGETAEPEETSGPKE